jgi:hypothetical protein
LRSGFDGIGGFYQLKNYTRLSKRLNFIAKNIQLRKKNSFFLSFYDWDRGRRFKQHMKLLNARYMNRVLLGVQKSQLQQSFQRISMARKASKTPKKYSKIPSFMQNFLKKVQTSQAVAPTPA